MADGAAVVFTSPADSTYWPQREPPKSYIRHNHMMAASTKKTTRRSVIHSNFVALSGAAVPDSSPPQLLFRASVTWLTRPLPVPP
jgi:hypothetical protein